MIDAITALARKYPPRRRLSGRRRGFALLAVLWVVTSASIIAFGMALQSRDAVGAAQNRITLTRMSWEAEGCMATALATAALALQVSATHATVWRNLDSAVAGAFSRASCRVSFRPAGTAVDVNAADEVQLRRLFQAVGASGMRTDSVVDAILDWRDANDVPRPLGAEREWYVAHGRFLPRNGPIAAPGELRRIRGLDSIPGLDSLLSPEGARILVTRAPLAVIASLPGVTEEAVTRIASHRAAADRLPEWPQLAAELSPPSSVELMRNLLELGRLSAFSPDAWVVEATATEGRPPLSVTRRVQLNPSGTQILPAATLLSPD